MDTMQGKINVKAINKDLLYKGEKGTYLNITLIPTPNSNFNSHLIIQDLSKEEIEHNKKIKENPNYDKKDLIQARKIGNVSIIRWEHSLTEQEKEDVF